MFNKIDTIVMAEKQKAMQTKIINKNGWPTVNIVFFFAFVIGLSVCSWVEAAQQINNKTEIEGIEGFSFRWDNDQSGGYTLSIKNKLEYPITNVMVMVVFYDHAGNIVDYQELDFSLILPTGLSKRIRGKVDSSTLEIVKK